MIAQWASAYLVGWLWALGITVGALPLLLIHQLTGGRWGDALRGPWLAAASTLPIVAIAFVPVLLAMHALYAWTGDWHGPRWWLDEPFFVVRAVAYFAAWAAIARWSVRRPDDTPRTIEAAAIGLIAYGITVTLAAFDWVMSLTPDWHSTVFGMLFAAGQLTSAFAFAVLMTSKRPAKVDDPALCGDFGNLLLTFTMLWTYLAFTQYLIIWIGNLPHDIGWYVVRGTTSWRWVGLAVFGGGFAVPFAALLFRAIKRVPRRLFVVALLVLAMRGVDLYWTVVPTFRPEGIDVRVADLPIIALIAVAWFLVYHRVAPSRPVEHAL